MVVLVAVSFQVDHHITSRIGLRKGTVGIEGTTTEETILVVDSHRPKSIIAIGNIPQRQRLRLSGCRCIEKIDGNLLGLATNANGNTHDVLLWCEIARTAEQRFRLHAFLIALLVVGSTKSQHLLKIPLIGLNKFACVGLADRQLGLQDLSLGHIRGILDVDTCAKCHQCKAATHLVLRKVVLTRLFSTYT